MGTLRPVRQQAPNITIQILHESWFTKTVGTMKRQGARVSLFSGIMLNGKQGWEEASAPCGFFRSHRKGKRANPSFFEAYAHTVPHTVFFLLLFPTPESVILCSAAKSNIPAAQKKKRERLAAAPPKHTTQHNPAYCVEGQRARPVHTGRRSMNETQKTTLSAEARMDHNAAANNSSPAPPPSLACFREIQTQHLDSHSKGEKRMSVRGLHMYRIFHMCWPTVSKGCLHFRR